MTKPTGRPRGRPKTSFYVTLMARVPQELADRVQRYAKLRQQPISVVLRDSLELLLEEERYRPFLSDSNTAGDIVSDMNLVDRNSIMSDMNDILSDRNESVLDEVLSEATPAEMNALLTESNPALDAVVSDMQAAIADILSDAKEEQPAIVSYTKAAHSENMSDSIPAFDATKYMLGKLCPRGHDYHGTGQSLRARQNSACVQCKREDVQRRRQAKRQQPA